jgi:uncharacterized protein YbjT (DUF2867 family)
MIRGPVETQPAVARLVQALAARGHASVPLEPGATIAAQETLLCTALESEGATRALLEAAAVAQGGRILILSRLGAHPDAQAAPLRALWNMEERARGVGLPALTLRIAPMLGPRSPIWRQLALRQHLPRGGRQLLNPVCESDVVETLVRALSGRASWEGWYEVAGPEVWSLAELGALAAEYPPAAREGVAAWEPSLDELAEHRLAEADPWLEHFNLTPTAIRTAALEWSQVAGQRSVA